MVFNRDNGRSPDCVLNSNSTIPGRGRGGGQGHDRHLQIDTSRRAQHMMLLLSLAYMVTLQRTWHPEVFSTCSWDDCAKKSGMWVQVFSVQVSGSGQTSNLPSTCFPVYKVEMVMPIVSNEIMKHNFKPSTIIKSQSLLSNMHKSTISPFNTPDSCKRTTTHALDKQKSWQYSKSTPGRASSVSKRLQGGRCAPVGQLARMWALRKEIRE